MRDRLPCAATQRDDVLDREQHDQRARTRSERRVVPALGDAERRDLVADARRRRGPSRRTAISAPKTPTSTWMTISSRRRDLVGHQDQQRLHADVAGVAHADRGADHRDVEDQHQRQALGPGRRVVQDVAAEHLPGHAGRRSSHRPATADDHREHFASDGAEAGEHRDAARNRRGIAAWRARGRGTRRRRRRRRRRAVAFTGDQFVAWTLLRPCPSASDR